MKEHSIESTLSRHDGARARSPKRACAPSAPRWRSSRACMPHRRMPVPRPRSQGLWNALRLFRDDSSHGRTSMNWFAGRKLFAGVASVCVVGLGIAMVWPFFSSYSDERIVGHAPAPADTVELLPPRSQPSSPEPMLGEPVLPELASIGRASGNSGTPNERRREVANAQSRRQSSATVGRASPEADRSGGHGQRDYAANVQAAAGSESRNRPQSGNRSSRMPAGRWLAGQGSIARAMCSTGRRRTPSMEAESRDKFQHFDVNPLQARGRRARVHVLGGRRHRVVQLRAAHVERRHAAAEGRGARRGDDQLLRLCLARAQVARESLRAHRGGQRFALGQGQEAGAHRHQGLRDRAQRRRPTPIWCCCSTSAAR